MDWGGESPGNPVTSRTGNQTMTKAASSELIFITHRSISSIKDQMD